MSVNAYVPSHPSRQAWISCSPILMTHLSVCNPRTRSRRTFNTITFVVFFRSWSTIWRASWAVTSRTPLSRWWHRCRSSTPRSCTTPSAAWAPTRRLLPRSWARSATEVSAPYPWSTKKVMHYAGPCRPTNVRSLFKHDFVSFHSVRQIPRRRFEVRHVGIVPEIAGVVVLREYTTKRIKEFNRRNGFEKVQTDYIDFSFSTTGKNALVVF